MMIWTDESHICIDGKPLTIRTTKAGHASLAILLAVLTLLIAPVVIVSIYGADALYAVLTFLSAHGIR